MIRILGSGSSGNAILVGDENPVLLDAGMTAKRLRAALRQAGTTFARIAFAAITHEHKDHAEGVAVLTKAAVDVVASRGTLEALDMLGHHRAIPLKPNLTTLVNGWGIIGIPVKHDAAEPLAFYVGRGGMRVLYVTDTAEFEPPPAVGKPTHVLIEANHRRSELDLYAEFDERSRRTTKTHLSIEGAIEALARLDLSECQSVHLMHLSDDNSSEDEFIAEVAEAVGVPVHAAQAA